ncbi:hypothetical protein FS935_19550 [Metabacillus litoralis]|uniref:Tetratricopeptide repeat protein n=1 Tax=Metabacillus litoralis TaxID=152268 RepID=A0A5C6VJU2_9BACI|nr:hypothetical protein [Metabacillus litoralis]TXC85842.1 hypothetical protein FS935_19550 [Metabacillus litoralis]
MILSILTLFILPACSNNNYEQAMDNGIQQLGEKNYHQASIYFELALTEKNGDKDARHYYDQATKMNSALRDFEAKKYESAIKTLDMILAHKNGLETIQNEAQTLKEEITTKQDQLTSLDQRIELINNLIEKNNYSEAKDQLKQLEQTIISDEKLASYQADINQLTEKIEKQETDTKENKKKEEKTVEKEKNIKEKELTYKQYSNDRFGFSFKVPSSLSMSPPPTNGDGVTFFNEEIEVTAFGAHIIEEGKTVEDFYHEEINSILVNIAYQRIKENWYVLSYEEDGIITYKKSFFGNGIMNSLIMTYPVDTQTKYSEIVTYITESFQPPY